jgi:uncharacterized membrane protein YhaH (DUF805 family)
MRGTILVIDPEKQEGIISTTDGRYHFTFDELKTSPIEVVQGAEVDFIIDGENAKEIYVIEVPCKIPYYEDQPTGFKALFSAQGCFTRWQYWKVTLLSLLIYFIYFMSFGFITSGVDSGDFSEGLLTFWGILGVFLILPIAYINIVTSIKRFHDINLSGWFYLLNLIPYIGGLIVLIMNGFLPSVKEGNRFCRHKK